MTIDAAALCAEVRQRVVLRGSSSAAHSNAVLARIAPRGRRGRRAAGGRARRSSPAAAARSWPSSAPQEGVVDLIIPRGGEGLKKALSAVATVPVIYAAVGQLPRLRRRARRPRRRPRRSSLNAKDAARRASATRPRRCSSIATSPPRSCRARSAALRDAGVELRGDERVRALDAAGAPRPTEADWAEEFLALMLAVRVVDSVEEAIEHVNAYGSGHSEAIVTRTTARRAGVPARRRRGLRLRQRLDALHRRRRVRHGRRDRQLDPEAARARADRRCASCAPSSTWSRATARSAPECGSGSSAGRSTRRTSAISSCAQEARDAARARPRAAACRSTIPPHKEAERDPGAEHRVALCAAAVARRRRGSRSHASRSTSRAVVHGRYPLQAP